MKTNLTRSILSLAILFVPELVLAQHQAPTDWHHLDLKSDKAWGVSTWKALKNFPPDPAKPPVIVAVIDGGTDTAHEDLQGNLWVNPGEISGNGIDDDLNGFVDDLNGWNFIGGQGGDVEDDTYEYVRILAVIKKGLKPGEEIPANEQFDYDRAKALYEKNYHETKQQYDQLHAFRKGILDFIQKTGVDRPTFKQVKEVPAANAEEKQMRMLAAYVTMTGGADSSPIMQQFKGYEEQVNKMLTKNLNMEFDPRTMVGDHYSDVKERRYGNNHVNAPKTDHGTHVAGIIAAVQNNDTGMDGICDRCKILTVRAVPNGDERDKDVANAIRYAVDNGARVVNMSFGKELSTHKNVVDEAVKYAMEKDVLLVHAAGNEGEDISSGYNFPNAYLEFSNVFAKNWVEVGACSVNKGKGRVATFSNFSKTRVDLFAPGVSIYSLKPGNEYVSQDGTSMASPVVAGVAALVRQRYPQLKAHEVRQILMQSAIVCKERVRNPKTHKRTRMKELRVTGGIVNAYQALDLADKVSRGVVRLEN